MASERFRPTGVQEGATSLPVELHWQLTGFEIFRSIDAVKARERALKHNPRMQMLFKERLLNRAAVGNPRQVVG